MLGYDLLAHKFLVLSVQPDFGYIFTSFQTRAVIPAILNAGIKFLLHQILQALPFLLLSFRDFVCGLIVGREQTGDALGLRSACSGRKTKNQHK